MATKRKPCKHNTMTENKDTPKVGAWKCADCGYVYNSDQKDERPAVEPNFTLTIRLGNDAMSTLSQVSKTLEQVAKEIGEDGRSDRQIKGAIADLNGNTVGGWSFDARGLD